MKAKLVTVVVLAFFATTAARAELIFKGGASGLRKAAVVRAEKAAPAMNCAGCKSEFVRVKEPTFKGTVPVTAIVERHGCGPCGTKWVTSGHGKAKVDVAVHTCDGCTM